MLIEALVASAMASPLDADHFSVGVPAEVDLVGLAFGVRPEVLWRPFAPDGATEVRAATGLILETGFAPKPLLGFGAAVRVGVTRAL